jgi:LemA protein
MIRAAIPTGAALVSPSRWPPRRSADRKPFPGAAIPPYARAAQRAGGVMELLYILLAIIVAVAAYVILTYNRLVSLRTRVREAWSDIQVQMKRRYDLIPNLVEAVKGYAAHESGTLENVVRARGAAMANTGSPGSQAQSENALQATLKSLFALAESYPQLRADQNFARLQSDLADTENRIKMARRYYNGSVRDLNVKIEQFPSNLVASRFGFIQAEFFELDDEEAEAASRPVRVDFGTGPR